MDTRYIYSANRVKSLETNLFSEAQLERLLSAKGLAEARHALHDTFLATYIAGKEDTPIVSVLRQNLIDTKDELMAMAPDSRVLNIFWLRYDFYNLKTILKGKRAGILDEGVKELCFDIGKYAPSALLSAVNADNLKTFDLELQQAYEIAKQAREVHEIDFAMNKGYFSAIKRMSDELRDPFISRFVELLIDLFNIKTSLRIHSLKALNLPDIFIPGGSIQQENISTKEQALLRLKRYGGEALWGEPIEQYTKTGNYSMLETTADDYVLSFLKGESRDIFSPATLFAFFAARRNNAQVIKTILIAKEAGVKEVDTRRLLRKLYA